MIVSRDVPKAADETALINTYKTLIAPIANKELGTITSNITKTQNVAGESSLGDLIADAQVNDATVVTGGKTPVVAFFLSDGGDNFPAFKNGTDKFFGGLDIDGFAKHLQTVSPYGPLPLDRITQQ